MPSETNSIPDPDRRLGRDRRIRRRGDNHIVWVSVTGIVALILFLFLGVLGLARLNDLADKREADRRADVAESIAARHLICELLNDRFIAADEANVQALLTASNEPPAGETLVERHKREIASQLLADYGDGKVTQDQLRQRLADAGYEADALDAAIRRIVLTKQYVEAQKMRLQGGKVVASRLDCDKFSDSPAAYLKQLREENG